MQKQLLRKCFYKHLKAAVSASTFSFLVLRPDYETDGLHQRTGKNVPHLYEQCPSLTVHMTYISTSNRHTMLLVLCLIHVRMDDRAILLTHTLYEAVWVPRTHVDHRCVISLVSSWSFNCLYILCNSCYCLILFLRKRNVYWPWFARPLLHNH